MVSIYTLIPQVFNYECNMKMCRKCNIEKDDSLFSKNQNVCKECNKQYRQEHKEEAKEYRKQYRPGHKEKIALTKAIYYQDNKE